MQYAEFNSDAQFVCFRLEIPFLGKFGPKSQNCQFQMKFDTYTNLNMQNLMAVLILLIYLF